MADIALTTAGRIEIVSVINDQLTKPAAVDITAGQLVYEDTSGNWALGGASVVGGYIATRSAKAGVGLTAIRAGLLSGFALSGLACNARVYAGASGAIATTGTVVIGKVTSAWAQQIGTSADKILHVAAPL